MDSRAPVSLLSTKYYFPISRQDLVPRPRLVALVEKGLSGPLTLISAPAGYGKTTLLSEWRAGPGREVPAAWLSLEPGDNDAVRFWTYLTAALDNACPGLTQNSRSLLQAPQPPSNESMAAALLQDILAASQNIVCALDDWHVITDVGLQQALGLIITHLPPNLHLALLTRSDPLLPLSRLRANQQLVEIRAEQLRFTREETASFLTRVMGLALSTDAISMLEKRAEGWVAGLQLAALSMQGRSSDQVEAFIAAFTGSHRYIVDYLVDEVLNQQPDDLRDFLLKTSILERLSPSLCNAVTGGTNSQTLLSRLEQSNLFLIPLDDERTWNRYHHLFRDLLRTSLQKTNPDQAQELHRRASDWYAAHQASEEAIGHALSGKDDDRAATLIEQAAQQLDLQNKLMMITRWIDTLPDEVVAAHPWLCVYRAWGYHWMGRRDSVEPWLQVAERAEAQPPSERNHILGHIAAVRAHSALTGQNVAQVLEQGRRALELLPEDDEMRCETAVALGGAYWALGEVFQSEQAFTMARSAALKGNYPTMAVPSTCYVGMQQVKQGRLAIAERTFRDGLRLATSSDGRETPVAGFPNIHLGDLLREKNELELARDHLTRGVEQCAILGQADVLTDAYVSLARFQMTMDRLEEAQESLRTADQIAGATRVDPFVQCWLEDCRLRLLLAQADWDGITRWVETCGLTPEGPFSYHYDLHHINLARGLVAQGISTSSPAALRIADDLLGRLSEAAGRAGWVHEKIHILILRAVADRALGWELEPLRALSETLALAEPGGYVRAFLDEGEGIWDLLQVLADRLNRDQPEQASFLPGGLNEDQLKRIEKYVGRLLQSVEVEKKPQNPAEPVSVEPAEVLSTRELEVLRLIQDGCSNQEIAVKLVIALSTVKRHTVNIFNKLNVTNRTQAVMRARELGLL